ncbi:MAG: AMP-binding protein [Pseudomonadota bacterium]
MNQLWTRQYPPGVPQEIDVDAYASIVELVERSCDQYRSRTAYECMGVQLSYDELDRSTQDFASYLQNVLGLDKGDRVALMMPNVLQYPVALFGVLRAGMVAVNVNPPYTPRALAHQLKDSGARVIVIMENFCQALEQVLKKTRVECVITTQLADLAPFPKSLLVNAAVKYVRKLVPKWHIPGTVPLRAALARGKAQPYMHAQLAHADIAFLQYTGGTAGLPKAATLTHGNIVANLEQMSAWMQPFMKGDGEIIVTALPLYQIFTLVLNCLLFLKIGAKNVLITDPRDLPGFVAELKKHRFTAFSGVNTLFDALLDTPGFDSVDFSDLHLAVGGGVQQAVAERWQKATGKALIEGYGPTECLPAVTCTPLTQPDWSGTIGVPLPSTIVSLRDDDDNEVPQGQPGELCVKGPQVMQGYWRKPEENAKVFTADGFLKTGDIAIMDERGYLRLVDRKELRGQQVWA